MLRRLALLVCALTMLVLTACTPTVSVPAAEDANNPLCAEVTVRLPKSIVDQDRRWTDAQATGAYGSADGTSVIVSCGVDVPGPTAELRCITLEGIDWLVDESDAPNMRVTTYGRDPAVQVFIDSTVISANQVLSNSGLVSGIRMIPAERACVGADELPQ